MLCTCKSCNRTFDSEDYLDDGMVEETEFCPDCFYSGDCLHAMDDDEFDPDDPDSYGDEGSDLELYEDDEDDSSITEDYFDGTEEDNTEEEELDDEDFDESDFEDFCEKQEGDYC